MSKALFTFKQSERLKKRKLIEALFKKGKALSYFPFKCIYTLDHEAHPDQLSNTQFGVSIPKKKIKKAVDRNLMKRRLREAWRLHKSELNSVISEKNLALKVFFIYQSHRIESYDTVQLAVIKIIPKLLSEINSHTDR